TVSRRGLFRTLRRLENRGKGLMPSFAIALGAVRNDLIARSALDVIDGRILPALDGARERAASVFSFLGDLFTGGEETIRLEDSFSSHPVWPLGLDDALTGVLDNLRSLGEAMELLRERGSVDEEMQRHLEAQLVELRGAANRVAGAGDALRQALRPGEDAMPIVRWIERHPEREGREGNLTLNAAPLDLAKVLRESLFEQVPTVVLTSATLATQGNFRFMRQRLGLTGAFADQHNVEEAIHPSP